MPPVAVDRFSEMVLKSVRKHLADVLVGPGKDYTGVFVSSPEFDHAETPDPGNPPEVVLRQPPYVTIVPQNEAAFPWEIGNFRIQKNVAFDLWVVCESFDAYLRRPAQVQQLFLTAKEDGVDDGVALLDFSVVPPTKVGFVEVWTDGIVPFLDISEKRDRRRLKHVGIVSCRVEKEKAKEAVLLV